MNRAATLSAERFKISQRIHDIKAGAGDPADLPALQGQLRALHPRLQAHGLSNAEADDIGAKQIRVAAQYEQVFWELLRDGDAALSRGMVKERQELRAFSAGTSATGGYAVPQLFADMIEQAQKQYSAIWNVATILPTPDSGANMPLPMLNLTADPGGITAENAASTLDATTPWSSITFKTYTYRSPMLPVSFEYLDDTSFGEQFIAQALGITCARAAAPHFTTGTGTGQPNGLVTAATVGKVGLTGQTLTVIYDDLADLVASLDAAYCEPAPGAVIGWMMHPLSLAIIRKLKDTASNPLIPPDTVVDSKGVTKPQLLGYPVYVNADMPVMAANAKSIAFGRLDKYAIRRGPTYVVRAAERYADNLQIGLQLIQRLDGNLMDAGTHPVKLYQNSAS